MSTAARKIIVLALALIQPFAVLYGPLTGQGQSIRQFAADGDNVLRAAGYAFAIWGVLYAACVVYGLYQAWPRKGGDSALVHRLGWPSAGAFACCIGWVAAAQMDLKWLTLPIILAGAASLTVALVVASPAASRVSGRERWLVAWPLAALAGWLTIASAVNLSTVLEATGNFAPPLSPEQWALTILIGAGLIAILVTARTHLVPYALTFGWGLVAVAVAEWSRHSGLAWAALIVLGTLALALRMGGRRAPLLT